MTLSVHRWYVSLYFRTVESCAVYPIKVDLSQPHTYAKHLVSTHYRRKNINVKRKKNQESWREARERETESPLSSTVANSTAVGHHSGTDKKGSKFAPPPFPLEDRITSTHLTTLWSCPPPCEKKTTTTHNGYGTENSGAGAVRKAKICHGGGSPERARPAARAKWPPRLPSLRLWPSSFAPPGFYTAILAL